ncbi:MAG: oxidoreductase [Actinomycetota bacterium]|nr:oxidoreductase [Actinomycetota bacterium]
MTWTADDIDDQHGRTAVVTGANAGLGLEIATRLAEYGATVVLACRNLAKAESAATGIRAYHPDAQVEVLPLDLADLSSVRKFVDHFEAAHDRLDLLVNNAGLMAVDESRTADGFETQLGVNHLGHFALTAHLRPILQATPHSRVAAMSSMGHRAGRMDFDDLMGERRYGRWRAYFQSKLANLLFTAELQRRLEAAGSSTIAVAAHPGGTSTDLGTEGHGLTNRVMGLLGPTATQPVFIGALPMLRALTAPDVRGAQYYGPRWLMAGPPVLETPSRRARNASDAQRLWELSAKLTGVAA